MTRTARKLVVVAGATVAAILFMAIPAGAQADLDCGDPGTSHNMEVEAGDPHGLDADNDGIGCEDPSAFEGAEAPAEPAPAGEEGVAQGAGAGEGSTMPVTGSTTTPLLIGGLGLIAVGAGALAAKRHVRTPRHLRL